MTQHIYDKELISFLPTGIEYLSDPANEKQKTKNNIDPSAALIKKQLFSHHFEEQKEQ